LTSSALAIETTPSPGLRTRDVRHLLPWGLVLVAVGWSIARAGFTGNDLINWGGFPLAWEFARSALRPDLQTLTLKVALEATWVTLAYALAGTTLCVAFGLVVGTLSSEIFWSLVTPRGGMTGAARRTGPWLLLRAVLAFPRGVHEVIWGLFLINIFGLDPIVAVLAIGIHFGVVTAKVFAEILDETASEPVRAMRASGASIGTSLLYGLFPLAFPDLLSYSLYRLECAIRAAAVLGLIGAGGLGYQLLLSFQSLRYDQVWTFLYALILLSGATDVWSTFLHRRMRLSTRTELHATTRRDDDSHERQSLKSAFLLEIDRRVSLTLALTVVALPWSFWYLAPRFQLFLERAVWARAADILAASLPPRLDSTLVRELWSLSFETLAMSILATAFAGLFGMILAFPAAANFMLPGDLNHSNRPASRWLRRIGFAGVRGGLVVLRALSEPVLALIVLFFLFPGILPGALGLGLYNLGVLGRLMAESVENLDQRPLLGLRAQGASPIGVFLYGVLPAAMPRFLSFVLYRWEVCIRATVLVGVVGAGGIGRLLAQQIARFDYPAVATSLLFVIGLCFVVDVLSRMLRHLVR
jgi:phosphonate transport system permease protein